jgi:hypothetical protein
VVLGEPVAAIAEPLAELRQFERLVDRGGGRGARADRRLVQHAQDRHSLENLVKDAAP